MPKRRIGKGMLVLMLQVSVLVDIIQVALEAGPQVAVGAWVNVIIDFCFAWIFWLWFKSLGVNFKNKGVLASFLAGIVLDFIPYVDSFAWTLDVLMVYASTKHEDAKRIAAWTAQQQGEAAERSRVRRMSRSSIRLVQDSDADE